MAKDAESLKIKSDDIDGCLAADFDGSLSGLGVEIVSNTYNMSEALEALPSLFKQETENGLLLHKITPLLTNHHLHLTSAAIHNNIINNNYHNSNINNLKINSTFIKRKINNDNKVNNKSNNNNNNSPISMEKLATTKEKIQPQEQFYTHSDAIFTYHIDEDDEEEDEDFVLKEDDYFFNEENIDVIHSDNNIDNVFSNNNNMYYNNNNNVNINTSIQTNSMVGVGNDNLNNKITLSADELFFNPCNDFINNNNHTYNHIHNYNNNNDNYSTSNNNNTANIASDNHTHDKNAGMPILLSNPILFNNTTSITTLSSATNSSTQLLNNKQLPTNNFNYILKAATSAGCRTIDEPITYLNQGQWYEVVLRSSSTSHNNLKSTIRLQVNNNRLQHQQQHIISNWSLNRPGEVMLQLDRSITGDTHNDTTDNINSVTFDWSLYNHHHHHQYHQQHRHLRILPLHSPDRNMASVFIKINCISSEFTPNKHGGEKGIPFKLQIETRVDDELHHVASCQVKVFKIKGADRKNKQERSRREKMAPHEREKYQECSEVTSFFEIPANKIFNQNNNNNITRNNKKKNNNNDIIDKNNENNNNNNNNNNKNNTRGIVMSNGNSNDGINTITEEMVFLLPSSNKNNNNNNNNIIKTKKNNKIIIGNSTVTGISTAFTTSLLASNDIHNNNNNNNMNAINKRNNISNNKLVNDVNIESISGAASINSRKRPLPDLCPTPLQASSTPEQAALWLSSNRFHDLLDVFENFSGCDLLCLSKDELAQICGLATGIRLYNLLHAKNLQPKLTIFVCHVIDTEYWSNIVPSVDLKQTLHDQQHNTAPSQQPIIPQLVAYNPQQHQQNIGLLLQHVPATQQVLEDRVEDLQAPALSNEHTDSLIRADHNYGVTTEPSNKIPPFKFDLINTKLSTTAHTTIQLNTASLSRDHTELALTSSQDIKADDKQLSEQNDDVIVLEKDDADQIALNSKQPDLPQKTTLAEVSIEHNLTSKHDLDETTLDPIMTPNNPPCYVILPSQNKNDGEDDGVGSEGNIGGDGGGVGGNGDGDSDDGIVGGGVCGGLDINAVCGDGSSGLGYDDDSGINSRGVASDGGDVSVCSRGDFEFTEEKNGTDILKSLSIAAEVHVTSANTAVKQPADELTAAKPSSNTLTASELTADSMTFEEKSTLPLISTTKTFSISSIFSSIFLPPTSTFASTKIFDATTMLIPTTTPTATQDQTQQKIKSSISPPTTQTHIPLKPITITRPKTTTTPLNASTTKLPTPIATSNLFSKKQPTATKPSTSTKPPTTTKTTTSRLPPQLTPACSCKRSISDFDEGVSSLMKKQRIVPSNHSPQQVFHAIYLNDLSLSHLLYKLASLFPLPATLVSQLLIRNSMGFYYLVDDSVVQNMREQSSYVIELSPDENKPGYFKILLKSIGF